jgi:hypothetical protein
MCWKIRVKVDICRLESYICHVVRNPQLGIKSIQIAAASWLRRLDLRSYIVVNKWNIGRRIRKKMYELSDLA